MLDINLKESPTIFNEYWRKYSFGTTNLDIIYNPLYNNYPDRENKKLLSAIKKLHEIEGNAITKNRQILVCYGCTHLLTIVIWVYLMHYNVSVVYLKIPYYYRYKKIFDFFAILKKDLIWTTDLDQVKKLQKQNKKVLEIITSPNNPDSKIRSREIGDYCLFDLVYNWPWYTKEVKNYDEEVVLYSASKAIGFAGQRIGWGIIKDPDFYNKCHTLINYTTDFISRIAQEQVLRGLNQVISDYPNYKKYMTKKYQKRWKILRRLLDYLNHQDDIVIRSINNSGPYSLWKISEDINLQKYLLKTYNIKTKSAKPFGLDKRYVRVNPGGSHKTFKKLDQTINNIQDVLQ